MGKVTQATTELPYENLTLRVPREWLGRLDGWREAQPVPPKRAEVIRLAVLQFIDRQEERKRK